MVKIVPEVPADAKGHGMCAVAHAAVSFGQVDPETSNDKNNIKAKHMLVNGFVI
jgi:hypothetical protein